ncbi:hypothetical protein M9Y10_035562 [Tritrichomonas musculus]|uniref:HNH nuclease domain-containing protein n=1 Tax=Tritrichomonas musculus TaxID=1915356 RepID=A0ABR2GWX6_9EUKA
METENIAEFVPLVDHDDYEILSTFPFTIRRKDNHREVAEHTNNAGYIQLYLHKKLYYKHRLVAIQFILNNDPEHKTDIDHINHDRADNHLENLRWCTKSENMKNTTSNKGVHYEYVNDIPEDSIKVVGYNSHTFEDYFYYDNNFYYYNGINYRKLHVNETKYGKLHVHMNNIENKKVKIYLATFKKMYDLE